MICPLNARSPAALKIKAKNRFMKELLTSTSSGAHILDTLGRKTLPIPRENELRVFLRSTIKRREHQREELRSSNTYYSRRIYSEKLANVYRVREIFREVSRLGQAWALPTSSALGMPAVMAMPALPMR
jgi:hypothetical protein